MKKITVRTQMYVSTVTLYQKIWFFWWPIDGYKLRSSSRQLHINEANKMVQDFMDFHNVPEFNVFRF